MEKKKIAKALVLTVTLVGGMALALIPSFDAIAYEYDTAGDTLIKKYKWCQKLVMYRECSYFGNGLACISGQNCPKK